MRVSHQHLKLAMARDRRDLGDVQTQLEEPADSLVAQIVEVKIFHLRADPQVLKSEADRVAAHREDSHSIALLFSLQFSENRDRPARQRNVARVPILRQGQVCDATNEINVFRQQWVLHSLLA